jgi:hypothetical protein
LDHDRANTARQVKAILGELNGYQKRKGGISPAFSRLPSVSLA